jgi:hypothetical protein
MHAYVVIGPKHGMQILFPGQRTVLKCLARVEDAGCSQDMKLMFRVSSMHWVAAWTQQRSA